MHAEIFIVDTFTSQKFKGNPTAVCILQQSPSPEALLSVAKELNFPVAAFIEKSKTEHGQYVIRYFTTQIEIPACGHATLASAKVVFELFPKIGIVHFETIEQINIEVQKHEKLITMSYPRYELVSFDVSELLLQSLGLKHFKTAGFCVELDTAFIELDDPVILRNMSPDYKKLVAADDRIKEVVITSPSDVDDYDFLLRSFCPWIGIDEDPVTGSVHAALAGFWSNRLGKKNLKAYQASERGGEAYLTIFDNRTEVSGEALIIVSGILSV